jgi:hypothetical protein
MKHYPKKYYSRLSAIDSHISSWSCLTIWPLSISHPRSQNILDMILLQAYGSYIMPTYTPINLVLLEYDFIATNDNQNKSILSSYKNKVSSFHKQLHSLWLFDGHWLSVDFTDHQTRYMPKSISYKLATLGHLSSQLVTYFWDFDNGCSVPDYDITFVPRACDIHRIRCFVDSKKESIILYMTDIHLLFAIVAIAVDPNDRRYKKLIWKKIIIPIINRIVPVVADESVSSSLYNGMKPIIPCHDRDSLFIAQRHNLPCDIYAIDHLGYFSSHASIYHKKHKKEFTANIIQYLKDIHNYDGFESMTIDVPFSYATTKYVWYFTTRWLSLSIDPFVQNILDYVASNNFIADDTIKSAIINKLHVSLPIIVSSSYGMVGMSSSFSIFDYVTTLSDFPDWYRTLLIFLVDMYFDWLLVNKFTIEDCIDLLFINPDNGITYCDFLLDLYADTDVMLNDIAVFRSFLESTTNQDTIVNALMFLLDLNDIFISDWNFYSIQSSFFSSHVFLNPLFLRSTLTHNIRYKKYRDWSAYLCLYDMYFVDFFVISYIITHISWYKQASWTVISSKPAIQSDYMKIFDDKAKHHSIDTLRMALLHWSLKDLNHHELVIQKIWNVCRYVYTEINISSFTQQYTTDDIASFIQQDVYQLTPFDQRILYIFTDIARKLHDLDDNVFPINNRLDLLYSCIIDDFAVKYIEVVKQRMGPLSHWVMLLCVSMICQFLFPFFPEMVNQIRGLFGIILPQNFSIPTLQLPSKNYKIHLLLLIIWALRKMKQSLLIKNHEKVNICIQWSVDITHFIYEHRSLIDAVVHIHDFHLFTSDQPIPSDYIQEYVIDIVLWLKLHTEASLNIDRLYILLKEKTEYLQHLRILAGVDDNEKSLKIDSLKKEIYDIEYQIMKQKTKDKH